MNQFLFRSLIFAISFLVAINLTGQDTLKLTLDEVIQMAQDQSPDAQIAKHRYRSSYWFYRSFRAEYLPFLQLEATIPDINRTIQAIPAQDGSTIYTPQSLQSYQVGLSLNQRIGFTGGEVFLSSGLRRLDNSLTDTTVTQYLTNIINIGYRQPIFTYNEYKWNKLIEPMRFEEAQRIYIETSEDVAIRAVDNFFQLLLAQIQVKIAQKNEANYDTLFRIAQGRYNLGIIAENELLQLELNLLQSQASVEDAELNYQNRLFLFKSYLRLQSDIDIELIPPVLKEYFDVSTDKALAEAKNNSSSGLEFKRRLLEAESQVKRAKMEGRFDAQLFASFGLTQTSGNLQAAYQNPLDQEVVTLGITLPILDWGMARGQIKMAQSNQDLEITAIEQERIDFEQNVFLQVMQFNMQEKQLGIAAKSDTVAQKRFEVTQLRYRIGKVNDVIELEKAQIDNDQAKLGYYQALRTYWQSYYQLRKLTHYDFQKGTPITVSFDDLLN
jgi:outer membrane protein TolC